MGLLSECAICHQFFSPRRIKDHVRETHGKQLALDRKFSGRVALAAEQQEARKRVQAKKNEATAAFLRESAVRKINETPLTSVWKEQVAKLTLVTPTEAKLSMRIREPIYVVQIPATPVRETSRRRKQAKLPPALMPAKSTLGRSLPSATVTCSCGGDNERCYRCDGRGYYEVSDAEAAKATRLATNVAPPKQQGPAGFASDSRGFNYGLREDGRFSSMPSCDDFGDESLS